MGSGDDAEAHCVGFCWFLKAQPQQDRRSELHECTMGRAWFWKLTWRFKGYDVQVLVASVLRQMWRAIPFPNRSDTLSFGLAVSTHCLRPRFAFRFDLKMQ